MHLNVVVDMPQSNVALLLLSSLFDAFPAPQSLSELTHYLSNNLHQFRYQSDMGMHIVMHVCRSVFYCFLLKSFHIPMYFPFFIFAF